MRRFLSLIFLLAVVFASDAECSAMDQSTLTVLMSILFEYIAECRRVKDDMSR